MPGDTTAASSTRSEEETRETRGTGDEKSPPATGTQAQGAAEDDDNPDTWDPKRAAATIRSQREAEKKLQSDLQAATRERDQLKRKTETEDQRRDRELEESKTSVAKLTERLRRESVRTEVYELAGTAGLSNPKLATRLLDYDAVEWDENEKPTNLAKLLKDLKAEYPEVAGATNGARRGASADAGSGTTGATTEGDMNAVIRQRAGRGA